VKLNVSESIERHPADVFRFVATDHVQNHPRWDPQMSLVQETPGPIGVGTRIRRLRTMGETSVEGEMEIIEYDPDRRTMAAVIRDAPMELRSSMTVEPKGEASTGSRSPWNPTTRLWTRWRSRSRAVFGGSRRCSRARGRTTLTSR
jgi:hypothetical protein